MFDAELLWGAKLASVDLATSATLANLVSQHSLASPSWQAPCECDAANHFGKAIFAEDASTPSGSGAKVYGVRRVNGVRLVATASHLKQRVSGFSFPELNASNEDTEVHLPQHQHLFVKK